MTPANVSVTTLLGYLPDSLLDRLSLENQVDKQVKKLKGTLVFKLLLYGVLSSERLSLNVLIGCFDKIGFRSLLGVEPTFTTQRNSLADRLTQLKSEYLAAIFQQAVALFSKHLPAQQLYGYDLHVFDSTIVACSAKLLDFGMHSGRKAKDETHRYHQLKFTIGFNGSMAETIRFYHQQTHLADDVPLQEVIAQQAFSANDVALFDRGLKSRKTLEAFSQPGTHHRLFVCRVNANTRYHLVEKRPLPAEHPTDSLTIDSDQLVRLWHGTEKLTTTPFRLIIAHPTDRPDEPLWFLTNILDGLTPVQVADMYRYRWQIEKFFRFIKQQMNFSHLLSRNYNGIQVMAYVMLIAAMLVALYAKLNDRSGYKMTKLAFCYELETELIKELIIRCHGDPSLLNQPFKMRFGQ